MKTGSEDGKGIGKWSIEHVGSLEDPRHDYQAVDKTWGELGRDKNSSLSRVGHSASQMAVVPLYGQ